MKLFRFVLLAGVILAVARVASANTSFVAHLAQSPDVFEQKKIAPPPRPRPKPGPKDGGEDE